MNVLLEDFKKLVVGKNNEQALLLLEDIKVKMLEFESLPPVNANTANAVAERQQAQQILEYAVILSVNIEDKESFQKHVNALGPYYQSTNQSSNSATEITATVVGLHLLYLLVENRQADFHCQVHTLISMIDIYFAIYI